jgi:hypothetical protein
MGSGNAEGQMRSIKTRVEKAGGLIVYEDAVRTGVVTNPDQLGARARNIAEQLLRPWVW